MPRNTRQWAIRKFDEVENLVSWCEYHLEQVSSTYREYHPIVSSEVDEARRNFTTLVTYLSKIRKSL